MSLQTRLTLLLDRSYALKDFDWCRRRGATAGVIAHLIAILYLMFSFYSAVQFRNDVSLLLEKSPTYKIVGSGSINLPDLCSRPSRSPMTGPKPSNTADLADVEFVCQMYNWNRDRSSAFSEGIGYYFAILVIVGIVQESLAHVFRKWRETCAKAALWNNVDMDHYYGKLGFVTLCVGLVGETFTQIVSKQGYLDLFTGFAPGHFPLNIAIASVVAIVTEVTLITATVRRPS